MGKVAILARVKENGAYPFYDPVWKNHKLISGAVLKNGIETAHPSITYYFRFHDPSIGKQVTQNVGRNAADVLAQFVALCGKLDKPSRTCPGHCVRNYPVAQRAVQIISIDGKSLPIGLLHGSCENIAWVGRHVGAFICLPLPPVAESPSLSSVSRRLPPGI